MNPLSCASRPPAITEAARIAAVTCEPIEAPTERTSVFTPVASPVCDGGTASTIRFAIAANARPIPIEMTTFQAVTASSRAVVERHRQQSQARERGAGGERELGAEAGAELARDRPGHEHHQRAGSISRPAPVASRPKP